MIATANPTLPEIAVPSEDRARSGVGTAPPARLPAWQEAVASRLFRALAPRLRGRQPRAPRRLQPFECFGVSRRAGDLAATWYPADGEARGAVLMASPWHGWGQAFFHFYGRIEALREAGYHVMTFDPAGVGASGRPDGLADRDVDAALTTLRARVPHLPVHFWGVSFGGYWAHPVLARTAEIGGAFFEDVAPHFIEWSKRTAPWGYPCYLTFQHAIARAYRYLDLRRHAPHLRARAVAYVSGDRDSGVRPEETRQLAELANAECLIVPGADHLEGIRKARHQILDLALATFERASASR